MQGESLQGNPSPIEGAERCLSFGFCGFAHLRAESTTSGNRIRGTNCWRCESGQSFWCDGVSLPSETAHAKARTHPMIVQPKPILTAHARGQRGPLFRMATRLGKIYAPARTAAKPGAGKKSRGLCNRSTFDILAHGQRHGHQRVGWAKS